MANKLVRLAGLKESDLGPYEKNITNFYAQYLLVVVLWCHTAFLGRALYNESLHEHGFFWENEHADVVNVYGLNGDLKRAQLVHAPYAE